MRVCVTGASGFIGREVVKQLHMKGYDTIALVRDRSKASYLDRYADIHTIDLVDADVSVLNDIVSNSHAVIHLAAKVRFHPYNTLRAIMVDSTESIARICKEYGVRFVYVSSIAAYGNGHGMIMDEESICNPDTGYGRAKLEAEGIVMSMVKQGLDAIVLRPGYVYGYSNGHGDPISRMLSTGRVFWIGDATNYTGVVHVHDCARTLVECLSYKGSNRVFNVVDDEPVRWLDYLNYACSLLGIGRPVLLPYAPLNALSHLIGSIAKVLNKASDISPDLMRAIRYSARYSNINLKQCMNFRFVYPTYRDGLRQVADEINKDTKY
ncbi:NAD-dependent epimerase/dehydratase family protein [Candidatus Nitrosocaldus cavascurensis]|jgi:nucleoside-diphosphate-sugar epimerase|uniref:Putative UDP-glucose 4-epimerase n=1 Tax=Candidatus Nitrosocaldus cavascurensis TaxID=2058097 RepID=A0A2K5ARV2_9ARCH|nr:NAD(P)-dependent oxidoreductase [Candidatus Nitrosocaldus cavascurensis]SPC34376.1 putative UDP-glucose 4-epimerase [Candidatus Nitrosocaldus cavascurensis]